MWLVRPRVRIFLVCLAMATPRASREIVAAGDRFEARTFNLRILISETSIMPMGNAGSGHPRDPIT